MKKLLATSTALVLVAGAAVAEVKVSGNGRMGVVNDSYKFNGNTVKNINGEEVGGWDFSSRIRIVFTASGQTDGGLTFGGSIRADNAGNGAAGTAGNIFIQGAFGRLAMGDVDSAAEAAVGQVLRGYTGFVDDEWDHVGYAGAGSGSTSANGPVALYSYTFGATSVFVSLADSKDGNADGNILNAAGTDFKDPLVARPGLRASRQSYGIGVRHTFGDFTVAAGYETNLTKDAATGDKDTRVEQFSLGVTANMGDLYAKLTYHDGSIKDHAGAGLFDADTKQIALGLEYDFGATRVSGFYRSGEVNYDTAGLGKERIEAFGVGAAYDLGGGASVNGGVARWKGKDLAGDKTEQTRFQVGLNFTF